MEVEFLREISVAAYGEMRGPYKRTFRRYETLWDVAVQKAADGMCLIYADVDEFLVPEDSIIVTWGAA